MVRVQLASRGIADKAVLAAMSDIPRHLFVPDELQDLAYADCPLPIGDGQTISQPHIVAMMTELANPSPGGRVLEIGTGSGYQAAVLSKVFRAVFTLEIIGSLATAARSRLEALGCDNVCVRVGDGRAGWPEEAPFDAIVVTAAPERVPDQLSIQLKAGGRMVIPVGPQGDVQQLMVMTRHTDGRTEVEPVCAVLFVPLV